MSTTNPRLVCLKLASTFGELPDPLRAVAPPRAAAHIPLPIAFPDQTTLDQQRAERLAGERALDREISRDAEVQPHREHTDERMQIALRAASADAHDRGFNAGFWHGFKCGGWLGLVLGGGIGWVLCVAAFKLARVL